MAVKGPVKGIGVALLFGAGFFGLKYVAGHSSFNIGKSTISKVDKLPPITDTQLKNVKMLPLPSTTPAQVPTTLFRADVWEWNAMMGFLYANGGPDTTVGSIMERNHVNLHIQRQDANDQMGQDLIKCAKEIHDGAEQCSTGANFIIVMGDGMPQWAAQLNPQLKKLGDDYQLKVIGAVGYSRGEDVFMAPAELKAEPKSFNTIVNGDTKGILVAGVILDGDWNIANVWAAANGIANNPDLGTYDSEAINWMSEPDYNTAASDYVAGKCEQRKEVSHGKLTGKQVSVCLNSVVSWTPGDVTVAMGKGGIVPIVSSREYRSQMPSVIVGPGAFFAKHQKSTAGLLAATFEGSDQVRASDDVLKAAAKISAVVYNDEGDKESHNGAFWAKYFKGVKQKDVTGTMVSLGGSAVSNLADNKVLFGLQPGFNDNFSSIYKLFSEMDNQQYPERFKSTPIPPVASVVDKRYIAMAETILQSSDDVTGTGANADVKDYDKGNGAVVSKRSYSINFATGSARVLPDSVHILDDLKNSIAITGLRIRVDGYTDSTGNPSTNVSLSQSRADAVKTWLQSAALGTFPSNRFNGVEGHGQNDPICSDSTPSCLAKNRRVEITLLD